MFGKWDVRRLYLYLVSFATLMMMVFGCVQFLQGLVTIVYPSPSTYYVDYSAKYSTPGQPQGPTPEDLKKQADADQARQHYYDIRNMINNLILLLVALPVYLYHWRKIQRTEIQAEGS